MNKSFLYDENFFYLINSKRSFSFTSPKFSSNPSDIDKIFESLAKHQEEVQKLKKELDEIKEHRIKEEQAAAFEKEQAAAIEKQEEHEKQQQSIELEKQQELAKHQKVSIRNVFKKL